MKLKWMLAGGVLAVTILGVVLMMIPSDPPTVPAAAPTPVEVPAAAAEPALPVAAPAPAAPEEDPAEIKEVIEAAVDREPAWNWLIGLVRGIRERDATPQMPPEEYEKARGLFERFLVNFARIETARFHVESEYRSGGKITRNSQDIIWSSAQWTHPKYRITHTGTEEGRMRSSLEICNGKTRCEWPADKVGDPEAVRYLRIHRGTPAMYFDSYDMAELRQQHPSFLNELEGCEIDDGKTGYSRVWRADGYEARFDTATGLLTERRFDGGGKITETFQQVDGIWVPRETIWDIPADPEENEEAYTSREVFSNFVLNEPVNNALFDVNKPF